MKPIKTPVLLDNLVPVMQEAFEQGKTVTLTVAGNSMQPLLAHDRDSVILSAHKGQLLKRGDVPLYRRATGEYVLHRIVRVKKNTYVLAGDAQRKTEQGVPAEAVLAQMTAFVRKGKAVSCANRRYRLFVAVWLFLRPVRPLIFSIYHKLRGGKR